MITEVSIMITIQIVRVASIKGMQTITYKKNMHIFVDFVDIH